MRKGGEGKWWKGKMRGEYVLLVSPGCRSYYTFLIPFTVRTTSSVSPENAIGAAR